MAVCTQTTDGSCCVGTTCFSVKECKCACLGGSFRSDRTCATSNCYRISDGACFTANHCACTVTYNGVWYATGTCDCRTHPNPNVCDPSRCRACSASFGTCYSTCLYPRDCCYNSTTLTVACCLESQECQGGTCVNRCAAGQTYCRTSLNPFTYTCCPSGQDCCNGQCIGITSTNTVQFDLGINDWTGGPTVTAGKYISVTATAQGSAYGTPGRASWNNSGGETTPDGVGLCCAGCNVDATISHMALIGKIGAGGTPFLLGASGGADATASGQLFVRHNGTCVGDYTGQYVVTIVVRGCNPVTPSEAEAVSTPAVRQSPDKPHAGPGTELKALLKYIGIVAKPDCPCNTRAAIMDEMEDREPGWCLANIDTILDWLKEQAENRGLPFVRAAAKLLVKRAISNAKRKSAREGNSK